MSKRRVFDIDFDPQDGQAAPETKSMDGPRVRDLERRGPMASAITENAAALSERQGTEAAIRDENDRLAHEYVALKKDGAIVGRVLVNEIHLTKLTRDRSNAVDPELDELKASIREVGLSNPIHVEEVKPGYYELIQGFRRWSAYKGLLVETGDDAYARIPAVLWPMGRRWTSCTVAWSTRTSCVKISRLLRWPIWRRIMPAKPKSAYPMQWMHCSHQQVVKSAVTSAILRSCCVRSDAS